MFSGCSVTRLAVLTCADGAGVMVVFIARILSHRRLQAEVFPRVCLTRRVLFYSDSTSSRRPVPRYSLVPARLRRNFCSTLLLYYKENNNNNNPDLSFSLELIQLECYQMSKWLQTKSVVQQSLRQYSAGRARETAALGCTRRRWSVLTLLCLRRFCVFRARQIYDRFLTSVSVRILQKVQRFSSGSKSSLRR